MNVIVNLTNVSKTYKISEEVSLPVLKNINLSIQKGTFVAIVGPSGSGKTTLMNIIGLLDRPTKGTYDLEDQDVSRLNDDRLAEIRNKKIGFVFQTFNLLERTTSLTNVSLPLVYSEIEKGVREERAKEALTRVGLPEKFNSFPNQLSGGEEQRVAIARALVTNPQIILADEPTGNLDTKTGREIIQIFKDLNKSGTTLILITHSKEVARSADRIIKLRDGKIIS